MKFNFKAIGKNIGEDAMDLGGIMAGAVASRKFIDLDKLLEKQDPESFLRKHQGGVKAVAALAGISMLPKGKHNRIMRNVLLGVALDGALREVRMLTTNKETGASWMEQIGNNVTDEFPSSVAGEQETFDLDQNGTTAVAGMGMDADSTDWGDM